MAADRKALVLLAGTPGIKRTNALDRIKEHAGGRTIASEDVDKHLRSLVLERIAAGDELAEAFHPNKEPTQQRITWKLAQDHVCKLWSEALIRALGELAAQTADAYVLVSHLTYYRGETHEFYSPAARGWETLRTSSDFEVKRIVTLIDDVYDGYVRLSQPGEVFDIQTQITNAYAKLAHDRSDAPNDDNAKYRLAIGVVVRTLLRLLAWREKEILTAENLAGQSGEKALVVAVKHPVEMGVGLVFGDYEREKEWELTYLSHPISRPRRTQKKVGSWPPFVSDFHDFIEALYRGASNAKTRCLPIMPTAIDEYRVLKDEKTERFMPQLAARWPLLREKPNALLFQLPDGYDKYEDYERDMIAPIFSPPLDRAGKKFSDPSKIWDALDDRTKSEVSGLLRALVMTIELQMTNRDHLLVRQCPGFLLYRPLYEESRFSDGVAAEISNRKDIVDGLGERRPLLFIHTSEDTRPLKLKPKDVVNLWAALRTLVHDKAKVEIGEDAPDGLDFAAQGWFDRVVETRESELSSGKVTADEVAELRKHQTEIVEIMTRSIRETQAQTFMAGVADDPLAKWIMRDEILGFAQKPRPQRPALWDSLVKDALTEWLDGATT